MEIESYEYADVWIKGKIKHNNKTVKFDLTLRPIYNDRYSAIQLEDLECPDGWNQTEFEEIEEKLWRMYKNGKFDELIKTN